VEIDHAGGERDWTRDAERTLAAMREGADVIYQGVLAAGGEVEGEWHGVSDFLVRTDAPSPRFGAWSYEAWDTKLARRARPYHILQLCFYSGEIGRLQGTPPARMHVVLGTGEIQSFQYADFDAYYRAVRRRFILAASDAAPTYPYPVPHCSLCEYSRSCAARRQSDDHLSLVAGIRRTQVERLNEAGVRTVAELARIEEDRRLGIGGPSLKRLRQQAALQMHYRTTGQHGYELLSADEHSGFRLLPAPSPGDIFFDMEGDPYFEPVRGLEYLFGMLTFRDAMAPAGAPVTVDVVDRAFVFSHLEAFTREEEKLAFERFIDLVHDRLRRFPDLHVYHYAAYEITALKRLMSEYGTREDALDDLLRREMFVDLYQIVRQSIRISHAGYSLKQVRTFFMPDAGRGQVADGGASILEFERWRASGDPAILEAIVRYNEEDCVSTLKLRDWLLERKQEAERRDGTVIRWKVADPVTASPEREAEDEQTRERRERLLEMARTRRPGLASESSADQASRADPALTLLADLLNYHRREAKPEWWAYFDRQKKSLDDLVDDTLAIGRLEGVCGVAPELVKRSRVHTLQFPPQEFKLAAGAAVDDPFRGTAAGEIAWIDARRGRLGLKRGPGLAEAPMPSAIVCGMPLNPRQQRAALARVADAALAGLPDYAASRAILERAAPRVKGRTPGAPIQTLDLAEQQALVAALDDSYLFIQGPPGSGKTWTGARLIVALMQAGRRVGVAATSHKAINNLLAEVEKVALAEGVAFTGLKKGNGDDELRGRFIRDTDDNEECETTSVDLIAGTAWLFSRAGLDRRLDYLFVDEAGQVALADVVAMGTAARNLVLLGDPQQLPQVRQGLHPGGSGASVLEHLLGDASTVREDRGLFLARTWRMHPEVCGFISTLAYDGRLESVHGRERQRIDSPGLSGSGLRFIPVEHAGNAQQSPEEAAVIAREVDRLLDGGTFTDAEGLRRRLEPADILVVVPYNMQVRCVAETLPPGVEVGTVDKFQGREAPVVFFSMASSTGDEVPRGPEFLFSRNRFNVAISRARAMAVVVCSPRLLETRCRTVDQMRLVNGVCRFAEAAS
jgi:uncharacterized protein